MIKIFILLLFGLGLFGIANGDQIISTFNSLVVANGETSRSNTPNNEPSIIPAKSPVISEEKDYILPSSVQIPILPGKEIFNFKGYEPPWYTIDDSVMGGVSRSAARITDPGILTFSGIMSLENNGGFTSVRSEWIPTSLKNYNGVLLRVLGDGKMYRLRIYSTITGSEIAYNAVFKTDPGAWKLVYLPFEKMVPTFRGIPVNVGRLNPASIASFGIMLSDKQPGEFSLKVDWIRAISEQELAEF